MSRSTAEQSNALSIFWLKKQGYLQKDGCTRAGTVSWSYGSSENKSSVGIYVVTGMADQNYIRLQYTHTDQWSGEKSEMDSKIEFDATSCHYGGKRYWFVCPLYKRGEYCGRRVGVIYSIGKWFGCRHCGNIAYTSQMQGGRNKGFVSVADVERAEKEVKRYYYNGKPTRKYRRVIRMDEKFEKSFISTLTLWNERLN